MNARYLVVPFAAAVLLAPALALSAQPNAAGAPNKAPAAAPATAPKNSVAPSFAGAWRLDRSKSTFPQRPEGGRGGGGMRGGMRGGMGGGMGGGEMGSGGRGGWEEGRGGARGEGSRRGPGRFMASFLRIDQVDGMVTLSDSSGTAIEEIAYEDPAPPKTGTRRLGGEWNGTSLVALGDTPAGGNVTETYTLKDGGSTLEIRTRMVPQDDRPPMEFVRVYQRVLESK